MRTEAARKLYSYICYELNPNDRRAEEVLRLIEAVEAELEAQTPRGPNVGDSVCRSE